MPYFREITGTLAGHAIGQPLVYSLCRIHQVKVPALASLAGAVAANSRN